MDNKLKGESVSNDIIYWLGKLSINDCNESRQAYRCALTLKTENERLRKYTTELMQILSTPHNRKIALKSNKSAFISFCIEDMHCFKSLEQALEGK